MATAKRKKQIPEQAPLKMIPQNKTFATAKQAYDQGVKAYDSHEYRSGEEAYLTFQNLGGNAHAQADFKVKFLHGFNHKTQFPKIDTIEA